MIEALSNRFHDLFDIAVVDQPAHFGVDVAFDGDGDPIGMAVQPPAFVVVGHVRQVVGGFEAKFFDEFDIHGGLGGPE